MKTSVLIVEDDIDLRDELADYLSQQGYAVQGVSTVRAAEEALSNTIDLLVLDINLPDGNGFDLCLRLRPYLRSGIVMCTGRSERSLRIDSLKGGADAYLVKPIDPEELLATLISVQRRSQPQAPSFFNLSPPVQWRLDSQRSSLLTPNGKTVSLSQGEVLLLASLFHEPQQQISRLALLAAFKDAETPSDGRRIEALVSRLRRKVLDTTGQALPVTSVYGKGYAFTDHAVLL